MSNILYSQRHKVKNPYRNDHFSRGHHFRYIGTINGEPHRLSILVKQNMVIKVNADIVLYNGFYRKSIAANPK